MNDRTRDLLLADVAVSCVPSRNTPGEWRVTLIKNRFGPSGQTRVIYGQEPSVDLLRSTVWELVPQVCDEGTRFYVQRERYVHYLDVMGTTTVKVKLPPVAAYIDMEMNIPKQYTASWVEDPSRFPHTCARCGAPAYNGLMSSECSRGCG